MTERIDAERYLGWHRGWEPTNGIRLANAILAKDTPWEQIIIDARRCPPELVPCNLIQDFLQRLYEAFPERLEEAKAIRWELYTDATQAVFGLMRDRFKPRATAAVVMEVDRRDLPYCMR